MNGSTDQPSNRATARRRRVVRETRDEIFERGRHRKMRFEWRDGLLECWPSGTRQRVVVSLAAVWQRAVKAEADERRRSRRRG